MKLITLFLTVLKACFFLSVAANEKPNALFIAMDNLNDWVGCIGENLQAKTPYIDKLHAPGGIISTKTQLLASVCLPAQGALLSLGYAYNFPKTTWVPLMLKLSGISPDNKKYMGVFYLMDMVPTSMSRCGFPANSKIRSININ